MDEPFEHVVIVGCGLLGASLGLALRTAQNRGLAVRITGVGRRGSESVAKAMERGAVDRITDDAGLAVSGGQLAGESGAVHPADLIVMCTPVMQFPEIMEKIAGAGAGAAGAVVTDVGSVKGAVMQWAKEILPERVHFVGSHPMAGSEQSGPAAARADLFQGAVCVVCPAAGESAGDLAAAERVKNLWRAVGMHVTECTAEAHDRYVAAISHLPHIAAALLVNFAAGEPEALDLAAGGFIDATRIAAGDVTMWTDILLTNREAILRAAGRIHGAGGGAAGALAARNEASLRHILSAARDVRKNIRDPRSGSE